MWCDAADGNGRISSRAFVLVTLNASSTDPIVLHDHDPSYITLNASSTDPIPNFTQVPPEVAGAAKVDL